MTAEHPGQGPTGRHDAHPSPDTLAEWDEELLDAAATRVVVRHLAGCESCNAKLAQLATIRRALRALPIPPVPPVVMSRLDTVLAGLHASTASGAVTGTDLTGTDVTGTDVTGTDLTGTDVTGTGTDTGGVDLGDTAAASDDIEPEHQLDAGQSGADRPTTGTTVSILEQQSRRERRARYARRIAGWAAAGVIALGLGAGAASLHFWGHANATTSAAQSLAPDNAPYVNRGSAQASSGQGQAASAGSAGSAKAAPILPATATAGAAAYTHETLRAALPQMEKTSPQVGAAGATGATGEAAPAAGPAGPAAAETLARCLAALPQAPGTLRAVERIRFAGQPAFVLVFDDGALLTGYVVPESCGQQPATSLLDTVVTSR